HYISYYENGSVIVRAIVPNDYRENLLNSPVEIVYLSPQRAELVSAVWIGNYTRMDHIPCLPLPR
ncbi:MAG: hypothetical protein AAFV93_11800, partial [Chloroflexota bacterium]